MFAKELQEKIDRLTDTITAARAARAATERLVTATKNKTGFSQDVVDNMKLIREMDQHIARFCDMRESLCEQLRDLRGNLDQNVTNSR